MKVFDILGESVRLISDVLEKTKKLNIGSFMLTIDIERLSIPLTMLSSLPSWTNRDLTQISLNGFRFCTKIKKALSWTGVPQLAISHLVENHTKGAYLFILVMEVFFTMVRTNPNIKGLNIFDFKYLLTSYADDTTFFIENQNSAIEIFNTSDKFSTFSGLKLTNRDVKSLA